MTEDLRGRVAIITGGTKASGRAVAGHLGARGARVVLNYFHDQAAARESVTALRAQGIDVEVIRASVAKPDDVRAMFQQIRDRYGRLDILVNHAAYGVFKTFDQITERDWKRMFDTNFHGARLCALEALPLLRSTGGSIVNVSSTGSQFVIGHYAGVGPTKAALEALTRYLAVEFGPYGIRVNTASLSLVDVPSVDYFPNSDEMRQAFRRSSPLARLATLDDLAQLVGFLVSDSASWITGQVITADGGSSTGFSSFSAADYPTAGTRQAPLPASTSPKSTVDPSKIVAVVGIGAVAPNAADPQQLWSLLCADAPVFSTDDRRMDPQAFGARNPATDDKSRVGKAGYLRGFQPDPLLRRELADGVVPASDENVAWLRQAARQALRDCGTTVSDTQQVFLGLAPEGSLRLDESLVVDGAARRLARTPAEREMLVATLAKTYSRAEGVNGALSHQIAQAAFRGLVPDSTAVTVVDAACASSLYAIDLGAQAVLSGDCSVALCGGGFVVSPRYLVVFDALRGLSPTGEVRALDSAANGTLFSDGAVVVALKRYDRAIADGDQVYGLIEGFGASSNGRGKAINASDTTAEQRAIERAFHASGLDPADIDWVVAHATGTRAGDRAELAALAGSLPERAHWSVTSNKSLLGHTGPAAGALSVVHALLGLRHDRIPAQRRYQAPPDGMELPEGIDIPVVHRPWPHNVDRPRTAGVASYGFGGTNAFLLLQEAHPRSHTPASVRRTDRLVLVGWNAHLPGDPDRASVVDWLQHGNQGRPPAVGDRYPIDSARYRLTGRAMRTIDRSQPMAMRCAEDLVRGLGKTFEPLRERTGVVLAMVGPTQRNVDNVLRCHLGQIVQATQETLSSTVDSESVRAMAELARKEIPKTNEDSLSGMMSNVAAGRVASHLNLHGLNVRIDAGEDSTLAALHAARTYLLAGHTDAMLLLAINAMTNEAIATAVRGSAPDGQVIAEGAFGFALTLESVARERQLPILADIAPAVGEGQVPAAHDDRRWVGAAGAVKLLRAVAGGQTADLTGVPATSRHPLRITPATTAPNTDEPTADRQADTQLTRYVVRRQPRPGNTVREALTALPEGTVAVTNTAAAAAALVKGGAYVLLTGPDAAPPGVTLVPGTRIGALDPLTVVPAGARHLRLVVDDSAGAHIELHDLAFAVAKMMAPKLAGEGSCALLGLNVHSGICSPLADLFTGFVNALAAELIGCQTFGLLADTPDLRQGLDLLVAESRLDRTYPVVRYEGNTRLEDTWIAASPAVVDTRFRLPADPVVLAVGGGRGITAALTSAVARRVRPRLWVIGSTDLDSWRDEQLTGPAMSRTEYLTAAAKRSPDVPIRAHSEEYSRLRSARQVHANLIAYQAVCGADRVHYEAADITDATAVASAVHRMLVHEGRVDMVLQGAGLNRAASLATKSLDTFRTVRDTVVSGHLNLKAALGDRSPRVWCNVGSIVGLVGQEGETDYASAHAFLSATGRHRVDTRCREITIAWPQWRDIGLAATSFWRDRLARRDMFTAMPTEEAVTHFLAELTGALDEPTVVFAGAAERRARDRGWRPARSDMDEPRHDPGAAGPKAAD